MSNPQTVQSNQPSSNNQPKQVKLPPPVEAVSLKPPAGPFENEDGTVGYAVVFVSNSFREEQLPCTKTVFLSIKQNKLNWKHRSNFRLRRNAEGVVSSIELYPKDDETIFKTGEEEDAKFVTAQIQRDKSVAVKSRPADLPTPVVDEIAELLQLAESIEDGDLLGGKYFIDSITKKAGVTLVNVDPTLR